MLTPIKSIRAHCLDCCGGSPQEVRLCPVEKCPLYPYRMGRRPQRDKETPDTPENKKSADSPMVSASNTQ